MKAIKFIVLAGFLLSLTGCNAAGKPSQKGITLSYEESAQVELVSPAGIRVLIDVYDPDILSSPPTAADVLLTTHSHSDHFNLDFIKSFPGQQIQMRKGELKLGDVSVRSIVASHNLIDQLDPEKGSDYIFIVDTGGLRFVHFGDLGQESLTQEQLDAIGKVDVAVMQFSNSYSSMSLQNKKGFNLMDQVKPRLIIPTHQDADTAKYATQKWPSFYWDQKSIQLSPASLTGETRFLIMGDLAKGFGKLFNLPVWENQ